MNRSSNSTAKWTPKTPNSETHTVSSFLKTVSLQDWWLFKVENGAHGKHLAVGGTTRESKVLRIFRSAPIVKRHDTFTLETSDGITILISGLINRCRTLENGFSSEVCSHFLIGFPFDWEAYTVQNMVEEPKGQCIHAEVSGFDESMPPLNDLPVTRIRDFLLRFGRGSYENCLVAEKISTDILENFCGNARKGPKEESQNDMKTDMEIAQGGVITRRMATVLSEKNELVEVRRSSSRLRRKTYE